MTSRWLNSSTTRFDDHGRRSTRARQRGGGHHRTVSSAPPVPTPTTAAAAVTHDIDALAAERDQFKDIALRLQADFDNYRKRVARAADRRDRPGHWPARRGVAAGARRLRGRVRARRGRRRADLVGAHRRAAEAGSRSDGPRRRAVRSRARRRRAARAGRRVGEPVVSEVLRTGYVWKGKVLRPAMVKVRGYDGRTARVVREELLRGPRRAGRRVAEGHHQGVPQARAPVPP